MSRKFITSILVAAITVTGISLSAAPARAASDEDIARFLFGITTLAIIGSALSNNDDDRDRGRVERRTPPRRDVVRRSHRKALPPSCLRVHNTWDGRVRMMGKRCLERRYDHVNRLPSACRIRVNTDEGTRRGYRMRCLRDRGFYLAG